MKAGTDETILEEAKPILQLERPLLPIDKYAAREGVSTKLVEKCGRLGIVQIRKYKGNTYVVDVPLSPYRPESEGTAILPATSSCPPPRLVLEDLGPEDAGAGDENRRGKQESHKMTTQATQKPRSTSGQPVNKTTHAPKISGLSSLSLSRQARKVAADAHKIAGQPATPNIEHPKAETMSALTKSMFGKASLIVCLFAAFLAGLWLYTNQRLYRNRLDQTSASIQNVYDDSVQTSQQLATFQSNLVESTAEFERIKNELDNTKAVAKSVQEDVKSLRYEIAKVRQGLETIQQDNITALEQLKEQFQQITNQLSKFTLNKVKKEIIE